MLLCQACVAQLFFFLYHVQSFTSCPRDVSNQWRPHTRRGGFQLCQHENIALKKENLQHLTRDIRRSGKEGVLAPTAFEHGCESLSGDGSSGGNDNALQLPSSHCLPLFRLAASPSSSTPPPAPLNVSVCFLSCIPLILLPHHRRRHHPLFTLPSRAHLHLHPSARLLLAGRHTHIHR